MKGQGGSASTARPDIPSSHQNLHCLGARQNVRPHKRCNEKDISEYSWKRQTVSPSEGWWPMHTLIRDKSKRVVVYRNGSGASAKAKARAPARVKEPDVLPSEPSEREPNARDCSESQKAKRYFITATAKAERPSKPSRGANPKIIGCT